MTTLFPKQDEHARSLFRALLVNRSALDTSETGTGKTIVAAHIANYWQDKGHPVAVVCPKAVITNWERVFADHDVSPLFVLNYEKLRNGRDDIVRIKRRMKNGKLFEWLIPADTLIIFDEVQACLTGDSAISLPDGSTRPIRDIRPGDWVDTPDGPHEVTNHLKVGIRKICLVHHAGGVIRCTHDHRLLTKEGWERSGCTRTRGHAPCAGAPL